MRLISILPTIAFAASIVHASPIGNVTEQLEELDRRAQVTCGQSPYYFSNSDQDKGYTDAIAHLDAGTTVMGDNGKSYPEYYGDNPAVGLPASCKMLYNDLRIYPVFIGGKTFTDGTNPNLDRVVISRHTDGTRERCGLITHRTAASGQFVLCK